MTSALISCNRAVIGSIERAHLVLDLLKKRTKIERRYHLKVIDKICLSWFFSN